MNSESIQRDLVTYLYIDGGYLREKFSVGVERWFGRPGVLSDINFHALKAQFKAFKIFYYDCIDDQPAGHELKEQTEERIEKQEADLVRIKEVPGSHLRLGRIVGTNKRNRRQKEVDVLLAVDALTHAARKNMEKAVVLSGDADFRPLVQSLVGLGFFVEVAGEKRTTGPKLVMEADSFQPLTFDHFYQWSRVELQKEFPLPTANNLSVWSDSQLEGSGYTKLVQGIADSVELVLYQKEKDVRLFSRKQSFGMWVNCGDNAERLKVFAELKFGPIAWT